MRTVRAAAVGLVLMVVMVVEVVLAPAASARWVTHNATEATEILPAPGGDDTQSCADRIRFRSGWNDPRGGLPPDLPEAAFASQFFEIYAATGGRTFDNVRRLVDANGNHIGFEFPDGVRVPKLLSLNTPRRVRLTPPEGTIRTATTIDQALPVGAVGVGDQVGFWGPGLQFDFITGLTVIDCESTRPACTLTKKTSTGIEVTVRDTGSGLQAIQVTKAVNATVQVPRFATGTKSPLVVTATKTNPAKASQVALRVTDVEGNITDCDPVLTTLVKEKTPQVFTDVPEAEHLVAITNGDPGLRLVKVTVNGDVYRRRVRPGQEVTIDVISSIRPGANTFKLRGWGPGSADIMIWDGQGTV